MHLQILLQALNCWQHQISSHTHTVVHSQYKTVHKSLVQMSALLTDLHPFELIKMYE